MPGTLFRIGQLAKRTGKTTRALHLYEERGLLRPAGRTAGGFRQYDEHAVLRIHWIERLQELGFSLSEIQRFLDSLRQEESGPVAMDTLRGFYSQKLIETRVAIARLHALENELKDSLNFLQGCQVCVPSTPREACAACDDPTKDPPALVAAVQLPPES